MFGVSECEQCASYSVAKTIIHRLALQSDDALPI